MAFVLLASRSLRSRTHWREWRTSSVSAPSTMYTLLLFSTCDVILQQHASADFSRSCRQGQCSIKGNSSSQAGLTSNQRHKPEVVLVPQCVLACGVHSGGLGSREMQGGMCLMTFETSAFLLSNKAHPTVVAKSLKPIFAAILPPLGALNAHLG